jgi:hypothetical protein
MSDSLGGVTRPGISSEFLGRHGIRHVDEHEVEGQLGFKAGTGIWIPYPGLNSCVMLVNERPYGRLRLDRPTNGAKYLSPRGSGSQLYIPQRVPFEKDLVIVEGEFKALALCEAGIRAVGIGGITSAMVQGKLIPDLARVLSRYAPKVFYFLGDNDTAFRFEFSREALKLAKALPEGCKLLLPRIPLSMPKGIDDCREELGDGFLEFWEGIKTEAIAASTKLSADALAVQIVTRELLCIKSDPDKATKSRCSRSWHHILTLFNSTSSQRR